MQIGAVLNIVEVGAGGGSIAWQYRRAWPAARRTEERGLDPWSRLLRPRRHRADHHRCQSRARPAQSAYLFLGGELILDVAAARRSHRRAASPTPLGLWRRGPAGAHWPTGIVSRSPPAVMARAIRRISVEHGPRSARLRAVLLWRGRAAARFSGFGARAFHSHYGGDPARAREFFGDRHAAGRCAARRFATTFTGAARCQYAVARLERSRLCTAMESRADARRAGQVSSAPEDTVVFERHRRDALSKGSATTSRCRVSGLSRRGRDPRCLRATIIAGGTATPTPRRPAEFQALHLSAFARLQRPGRRASCRAR
jgi:hypothetical protein